MGFFRGLQNVWLLSGVVLVSWAAACGDDPGTGGEGATNQSHSTGSGGPSSTSSSGSSSGGGFGTSSSGNVGGGSTSSTSSSTSGSSGNMPSDPCANASDGKHCGAELGGLADHNSLYTCQGGATQGVSPCQLGCENSACKVQMQQDPCKSAMSGNGAYCGSGLVGGDPNALYNCQNGITANKQNCPSGCQVNPPGVPDECKASGDPCQNASSGNGLYCGGSLGGDPNSLYNCQNGTTANMQNCPNGCQVMPPGQPDACAPSGNAMCCLNTPPGIVTQSFSACALGGSHYGIDYGTPVGTPIYAGMSGTVVGSALGFPNCYNNGCSQSCWNAFNYVKVKADCGDPNNGNKDFYIYYLHIDDLAPGIANGTHVNQGQLLAYAGNSGCSSGPHIHIETVSVDAGQNASLNTCKSVDPASRYCP